MTTIRGFCDGCNEHQLLEPSRFNLTADLAKNEYSYLFACQSGHEQEKQASPRIFTLLSQFIEVEYILPEAAEREALVFADKLYALDPRDIVKAFEQDT